MSKGHGLNPMKRLPPLPALYTFLVTAQCCNFTRAAQQLHITQGAVSRQIAGLESHLGYPLFMRQARGLSLTQQGRELFPRIQQVFGLIEEAVQAVGGKRQALQLKAPTCVMRWLWPRLMRWQAERPDIPVELTTTVQHAVDFRHESFDVAIIYGPEPAAGQSPRHLFDEELTPVCAPALLAGPVPLAQPVDLARHMLLHPTRDEQDWETWLAAAGATLPNLSQGQHFETLDLAMSVATQGTGVAIGDWALIAEDLAQQRLAMPFELRVRTGLAYYLVRPPKSSAGEDTVAFIDWLAREAGRR